MASNGGFSYGCFPFSLKGFFSRAGRETGEEVLVGVEGVR